MKRYTLYICVLIFISSCEKENKPTITGNLNTPSAISFQESEHNPYLCASPTEAQAGQIYIQNGKTWLWGGRGDAQDFDVSSWSLNITNLGSGLGRELIKALVFPTYENTSKQNIRDDERVIVIKGDKEIKVYTYDLLTKHELVNDEIDGQPILVGYCPLADLAVVYHRTYCDTELFFALSGYTYIEQDEKSNTASANSIESFILWDRNTESLWYPYRNIAVSGDMQNQKMEYYDKNKWELTTYSEAIEQYGNDVEVLSYQQTTDLGTNLNTNLYQSVNCD